MNLPKTLAELIAAQNNYDSKAYADTFSDDAVVYDEGKTYRGKNEIRKWNEITNAQYKTKLEPLEASSKDEKVFLRVKVSGTFDGSPITLKYNFEMKSEKIILLQITNS